jgi:Galactose oxidase, central domain
MKSATKLFSPVCLVLFSFLLSACSGAPSASTGGGGGGTTGNNGPYTISVSVAGLSGSGLVLADNVTDKLTVTSNGTFPFATKITKGATYAVTVFSQPLNPAQICVISQGASGTANASVTISVNCTTGAFTIGGQVNQLQGSGLVLQDNLGNGVVDRLTITGNGSFTFATPVATNGAYAVTVLTQPSNPTQTCVVTNGTGNASNNVGNIVVTCSVGTIPIGGSVVGLDGTGLTLLDNGGDSLVITANGNFTFPSLLASGTTYTVTIGAQPTGPSQTCAVTNGTGSAAAPAITNVQVVCPPVFEPIGGQVVGLSLLTGQTSQMVLTNNSGDNLPVAGNGPFTFTTQIAYGSNYDVSVIVAPGQIQNEGVVVWNWRGKALTPVTDVTVDWGHNDWAWMNGSNKSNQIGAFSAPTPPITTFIANSPGGRRYPATWTDLAGNLWLFGGYGYNYASVGTQAYEQEDMWEYTGTDNYFAGILNYWNFITPLPPPAPPALVPYPRWGAVSWTDASGNLWLFGGQSSLAFLNDLWVFNTSTKLWTQVPVGGFNQNGTYGTQGVGSTGNLPGGRVLATARYDSSTNVLWLFGGIGYDAGSTVPGLLNDLWTLNLTTGQWTWMGASSWTGSATTNTINQDGVYGTVGTAGGGPGGRQGAASWLDNAGNFWIFGGYNLSGSGQPDAFNDLWKYSAGEWTWVNGSKDINQAGNYGTQGVSAASNVPGARWSAAAWTDVAGNLWLFGGQGYDPAGNGSLADLWAFNPNAPAATPDTNPYLPASGQWVWIKGPNSVSQAGIYGIDPATTAGTVWPHVTNNPSTRYGAGYWTVVDFTGQSQFYLFGGEGYDSTTSDGNGLLNDLQRYFPYP